MSLLYNRIISPLLFRFDAENAHNLVFALTELLSTYAPALGSRIGASFAPQKELDPSCEDQKSAIDLFRQRNTFSAQYSFPVGIAAGFDKDARILSFLNWMGVPFIEVGTVTPRAQQGNMRPRVFRLKEDRALINRMGFPSAGVEVVKLRIEKYLERTDSASRMQIFCNIGKNKETANEDAWKDYLCCFEVLASLSHVFVINVSSPNTPGLRELQTRKALEQIVTPIVQSSSWSEKHRLLIKLSPDEDVDLVRAACELVHDLDLEGLVLTNTTRDRPATLSSDNKSEEGGLSGEPLFLKSVERVRIARELLGNEKTIIGVGGVSSGEMCEQMLRAGANLIEVYSAMIYRGPAIFRELQKELF